MRSKILLTLALLAGSCAVAADMAWAAGDAAKGEAVFKRCAICHSVEKGVPDGLGPNLFGIVGQKAGAHAGFPYSAALRNSGVTWTQANLIKWSAGPARMVPGTKMIFPGITSKAQQADLAAYLATRK